MVRLELSRVDHGLQVIEVTLARPAADPDRIRPLLAMKLGDVDAGFGFDQLRLVAPVHEAVRPEQHRGPVTLRGNTSPTPETEIEDLMGRIGARLGLEAMTRLHPGDSHAPEKAEQVLAAAWSRPAAQLVRPASPPASSDVASRTGHRPRTSAPACPHPMARPGSGNRSRPRGQNASPPNGGWKKKPGVRASVIIGWLQPAADCACGSITPMARCFPPAGSARATLADPNNLLTRMSFRFGAQTARFHRNRNAEAHMKRIPLILGASLATTMALAHGGVQNPAVMARMDAMSQNR